MKEESQNYQNNKERHRLKFDGNKDSQRIRSFGRIKSRKLSGHKDDLLNNLLPNYEINNFNVSASKTCLEIGFGFGDFLFEKAKKNPNTLFFGSEPYLNGTVNLLAKLEEEPLQNLKISREDVRDLLNKFESKYFDEVFILFPDPWPKSRHFKRRLISAEFLDKILSPKMKNGAKLVIATDHDSYKTWILAEILRSEKFSWQVESKKDWQIFPDDWVETKYQKKAVLEGREPVIFNLINHE